MLYVEIAVHRPVRQTYHYHIPPELAGQLQAGHLVEVEFGTARLNGVVVAFSDASPVPNTKPIRRLLDPTPVITTLQLKLALWIADTTLAPIGLCIWLMLPPGLTTENAIRYTLANPTDSGRTVAQKRVINLLTRRGPLTHAQLQRALPSVLNWKNAIRQLVKRDTLTQEHIIRPPRVRPKTINTARLAIPRNAIDVVKPHLGRESRRANVLEVLVAAPDYCLHKDDVMAFAGCKESPIKTLAKIDAVEIESGMVRLCLEPDEAKSLMMDLRQGHRDLHVLELLAENPEGMAVAQIYKQTKATRTNLFRLADDGLIVLGEEEVWRDPLADLAVTPDLAPALTGSQQKVWDVVREYMAGVRWGEASPAPDSSHVFLLHGVTGSGKTEIYMRAVEQALAQGRQAIILVPEIALTAQLVQRFSARFPGRVAIIHSGLSSGERYDTWRRARAGEIDIVVGARSALFAPLPDPGLVVLDEEHDDSYKQGPPILPPYYHAREVAISAMQFNRGTVILGSATPDIITMYRALHGDAVLLRLPDRVLAHRDRIQRQIDYLHLPSARYIPTDALEAVSIDLPPVTVVDMRHELKAGNRSVLSRALQEALIDVLNAQEQAILFLNRRGTSTFILCRDCGYIAQCPNCDTPLTYHAGREQLVCHYCGTHLPIVEQCPECNGDRIRYFGTGTEKIHRTLQEMFPDARVLRWDQDTASQRGAHERILQQFMDRQADILVGTQMIAKGLDIPLVTLVGIISGDTALGLPDFRVSERTFQLLTQVAGRAGRGLLGGRAILQTYQPDHYAIAAAAKHDYHAFYEQEIVYREMTRYPPFAQLARVLVRHHNQAEAMREAETIATFLRTRQTDGGFSATEVIGPTPCFFMRLDKVFRWQILVRSPDPTAIFRDVDLGQNAMLDIDPVDLL